MAKRCTECRRFCVCTSVFSYEPRFLCPVRCREDEARDADASEYKDDDEEAAAGSRHGMRGTTRSTSGREEPHKDWKNDENADDKE